MRVNWKYVQHYGSSGQWWGVVGKDLGLINDLKTHLYPLIYFTGPYYLAVEDYSDPLLIPQGKKWFTFTLPSYYTSVINRFYYLKYFSSTEILLYIAILFHIIMDC